MSQNVQNKCALGAIIDASNQTILVAVDVEYRPPAHGIRVCKVAPQFDQGAPIRPLRNPVPIHQWSQRIRVPFCEPKDRLPANDPHTISLQNEN
jgi:hypothetical protein